MKSEEYVKNALAQMGELDTFGTRSEIKELPKILHDDEELLYITSGVMDGNTWLVAATSERVIFLDKGLLFGMKQVETPLEKINSIVYETGLFFGGIKIYDGSSYMMVKQCQKNTVKPFVDAVNMAKNQLKENQTSSKNNLEELERLASLKEKGVLSEEEFQAEKQKLMNKKKLTAQDFSKNALSSSNTDSKSKSKVKNILSIVFGFFIIISVIQCKAESDRQKAIQKARERAETEAAEALKVKTLEKGVYWKFPENKYAGSKEYVACDTKENFEKYMETLRGDTKINHVKNLVESKRCIFLKNSLDSDYFIRVAALNKDGTKVTQVLKEDFFGKEKKYFVDITPDLNDLTKKRPSSEEYKKVAKIINDYNQNKKGNEVSFEMARVFCKSRKLFHESFLTDKSEEYENSGKCVRIKSGTKLRYEEMDDYLAGYTVLSGPYKGMRLYGYP
jgi:hypothetical protein